MEYVWIVQATDPCTREHRIARVFPGTTAGEADAESYIRACEAHDPSGPDFYKERWIVTHG